MNVKKTEMYFYIGTFKQVYSISSTVCRNLKKHDKKYQQINAGVELGLNSGRH